MTIRDFVLSQKAMSINDWISLIKISDLEIYEAEIIKCADYYEMITINHSASFIQAIN